MVEPELARSKEAVVIGVDLGTSGVRAIAYNFALRPVGEKALAYGVQYGEKGESEQDTLQVVLRAEECLAGLIEGLRGKAEICSIVLCGTASSLVVFEQDGSDIVPATPAWIWADSRAAAEAKDLKRLFGLELYQRTGCPFHSSYWPAKLLWLRRNAPATYEKAVKIGGIKDYVFNRFTGEWVTDYAIAAATGVYDSRQGQWDKDMLEWLGVDERLLPTIVAPGHQAKILPRIASRLGLSPETPVLVGSLDGVLVHLGLGCLSQGMASCMIGTSGAVRFTSTNRVIDALGRTWCYPLDKNVWVAGGAVNNGGNILEWFGRLMHGFTEEHSNGQHSETKLTADRLVELGLNSSPGAAGLTFIPYVFGERSPLWRNDLSGVLLGLAASQEAKDVARALLEGVSFGLKSVFNALVDQLGVPTELRASGGFTASPDWLQMQADIFGVPLHMVTQPQATAAGAAMIGWAQHEGAGIVEYAKLIAVNRSFWPIADRSQQYQAGFQRMETLRRRIFEDCGDTAVSSFLK